MTEPPTNLNRFAGFVDLQVNGFGGTDFAAPDLTRDQAETSFQHILSSGTAAFLPTLVSAPLDVYLRNLPLIAELARAPEFAGRVLGVHLEGPFLVDDARVAGAHRQANFMPASIEILNALIEASKGMLRLLTVSAELPGIGLVIKHACAAGIRVSIGHSYYGAQDLSAAASAGATALTHFGNALPTQMPRHDNPIVAGLAQDKLSAMVILDGHHLPRDFFKTVFHVFGTKRIIMTSDLSPISGLPAGPYNVFDQDVTLTEEGIVWNAQENHFSGAARSMLQCANIALDWPFIDASDLFHMGVIGPLNFLGLRLSDVAQTTTPVGYVKDANRFTLLPAGSGTCVA